MEFIIIILILGAAIILLFATKFMSITFKIIAKLMLLIILILLVLTVFVFKDMNDLRRGFKDNNNTFFLIGEEQVYTAVILKPMKSTNLSMDSFGFFTKQELDELETSMKEKNYDEMLNNNYKAIMIKPNILNKSFKINLGAELNQQDLLDIIMSDKPFFELAKKTMEEYNVEIELIEKSFQEHYQTEEQLKGYLFAALLANYFQKQKPGELVKNVKNQDFIICPESISFKMIKYFPWM